MDVGNDRALGRVEGKLDHIIRDQEQDRAARKQQYERQEKTDRLLEDMARQMKSMNARLEKVEEPVADFNRWRERGVGAVMLVSFVAASVGGLFVTFGKKLWAVIYG